MATASNAVDEELTVTAGSDPCRHRSEFSSRCSFQMQHGTVVDPWLRKSGPERLDHARNSGEINTAPARAATRSPAHRKRCPPVRPMARFLHEVQTSPALPDGDLEPSLSRRRRASAHRVRGALLPARRGHLHLHTMRRPRLAPSGPRRAPAAACPARAGASAPPPVRTGARSAGSSDAAFAVDSELPQISRFRARPRRTRRRAVVEKLLTFKSIRRPPSHVRSGRARGTT